MSIYTCWDESGTRVEITAEDAEEAAREYVDDADYPDEPKTYWIEVTAVEGPEDLEEDEREEHYHLIAVNPEEPDCEDGHDHNWEDVDGSLRGHGGGVVYSERCIHCGCIKKTDTWARHQSTGEEGLESVEYELGAGC